MPGPKHTLLQGSWLSVADGGVGGLGFSES